jgi:predicted  nucleic acid-binding Zn-ribbon protein
MQSQKISWEEDNSKLTHEICSINQAKEELQDKLRLSLQHTETLEKCISDAKEECRRNEELSHSLSI